MPKITDFKKNDGVPFFKKQTYTPWDNSPGVEKTPKPSPGLAKLKKTESNLEIGSKEVQNGFETGSKKVQLGFNTGSEIGSKEVQIEPKIGSKISSKEVRNIFKMGSKEVQKGSSNQGERDIAEVIYRLSGSQKKILLTIVEICSLKGMLKTPPINITEFAKSIHLPRETVKTSVRRLLSKNLIHKVNSRNGIGGFVCFGISENVKFYALEAQKNETQVKLILDQNRFKMMSEMGSEIGSEAPIVSSSNSFLNTTTTTQQEDQLPEEWLLDWKILSPIGFRESHLKKIYKATLASNKGPGRPIDPSKVRESMFALSHDLQDIDRKKTLEERYSRVGLVNVFVGAMIRGETWVPTREPATFKLPEERYLENQEAEFKKRQELIEKTKELKYKEWLECLPENELIGLAPEIDTSGVPEKVRRTLRRNKAIELSKAFFEAEVWPVLKDRVREEIEAF